MINAEVLGKAGIPPGSRRLLLKTSNSAYWANQDRQFHANFVGLDLSQVQAGNYQLVCLPLKLGAPAGAILIEV